MSEFPLDFGHNCRLISYLDLRSTGIKVAAAFSQGYFVLKNYIPWERGEMAGSENEWLRREFKENRKNKGERIKRKRKILSR